MSRIHLLLQKSGVLNQVVEDHDEDDNVDDATALAWCITNVVESVGEDLPEAVANMLSAAIVTVDPDEELPLPESLAMLSVEVLSKLCEDIKSYLDDAEIPYSEEELSDED